VVPTTSICRERKRERERENENSASFPILPSIKCPAAEAIGEKTEDDEEEEDASSSFLPRSAAARIKVSQNAGPRAAGREEEI
jgi:hypothetical protein